MDRPTLRRAEPLPALQEVVDTTLEALRAGDIAGLPPLAGLPPARVRLSGRLTSSAGIYRPPGDIALSSHYLDAHGVAAVRGVLLHEIAHHVVRFRHGRAVSPHGTEFRRAAAALGASLKAEAFAAPRTVYVYRCPVCRLESARGRRFARGRRYSCARCAPAYDDRFRLVFIARRRIGVPPGVS